MPKSFTMQARIVSAWVDFLLTVISSVRIRAITSVEIHMIRAIPTVFTRIPGAIVNVDITL